jgi:hypothetical protein
MMNKAYLDRQMSPLANYAGSHGLQTNPDFFNMPAASALTYGKDIFPNGWDPYANILKSAGGVNPSLKGLKTEPWSLG